MPPSDFTPREAGGGRETWPTDPVTGRQLAHLIRTDARRRTRRRLAITSVACLALFVGFWLRPMMLTPSAEVAAAARVHTPELLRLADGSVVVLRPGAEFDVRFTPSERRIDLRRGEALFEVAKDASRPFVVAASGVEVRAVGTAFSVELGQEAIDVLVTEGRVAVDRPARSSSDAAAHVSSTAPTLLDAGRLATVKVDPQTVEPPEITKVTPAQIARRLSWRVPLLEFSGTPLGEVIRLFADYSDIAFVLRDDDLRHVRISGMLRADNADALLQLLQDDHGIMAETTGRTHRLRRSR